MNFDEEQAEVLKPMAEARAILHVPFFANTFPLGYHYLRLLGEETARNLLREHRWEQGSPVDKAEDEQPHVYYAAENRKCEDKERLGERLEEIFFTDYDPRVFFLRYSVGLFAEVKQKCRDRGESEERVLTEELVQWIDQEYDRVEVFTDIPEQAHLVPTELRRLGLSIPVQIVVSWFDAFAFPAVKDRRLEAYFYGAPVSAALRRRPHAAIAFRIKVDESEQRLFRTYVCVVSGNKHRRTVIVRALDKYHLGLMSAANKPAGVLRNVWWVYNRYAALRQHNSAFPSPEAFARCLLEHHRYAGSGEAVAS